MNRQAFDVRNYNAAYNAAFTVPPGGVAGFQMAAGPPLPYNTPNADLAIGGNPAVTPFLTKGPARPPAANEAGWKDTALMMPGEVTRIMVRYMPTDTATPTAANPTPGPNYYPFNPNGGHGFVWHCHIIDHEDNEMMRPNLVYPIPAAPRTYIQGQHY